MSYIRSISIFFWGALFVLALVLGRIAYDRRQQSDYLNPSGKVQAETQVQDPNMVMVELSSEEKQALLDSQSVPAAAVAAAGVRAGPDGSPGEGLAELVEELNAQASGESRWVLDQKSGCILLFQDLGDGEFIHWEGECDSLGYATGKGILTYKVAEDDRITCYHGRMDKGIIGEGTFDYQ